MTSGRVVVVSNRLPLAVRREGRNAWRAERSSGGLVTALAPILERTGGLWVGWPGEAPRTPDARRSALLGEWAERYGYLAVDLPRQVSRRFYAGYANQTLWPLFHQFPGAIEFDAAAWAAYRAANERFRDAVLGQLGGDELVWIHDYHLMLLPRLLRETAPESRIGFFLHIPFPPSETFRILPRRDELLRGLLGADLLAFQTHSHLQNFRRALLRVLGMASRMDRVEVDGRFVRLEALPIGIAPEEFTDPLDRDPLVARRLAELRRRFAGRRVLLAVDRLDYTKGIPERLRAFRRLLETAPRFRGAVVLVQVAVPSRETIPRYAELRHQVSEMVGELNGDFGTPDWTPVVYIRRSITRRELVALYAAADLGWVTPLRDGMNLVAKEYVACQRDGDAVLLLSEFAGAAAEMGEAFLVNPYDEEQTAEALERALALPLDERRERMAALRKRVLRNNAYAWAQRFVGALRDASASRSPHAGDAPPMLPVGEAVAAFRHARRRLLLVDYDGTLVPYTARPRDAVPPEATRRLLRRLAAAAANRVALVSGRPRAELEAWFGTIDGLWLVAEHGALLRPPATATWETLRPALPAEWKARVGPVLEHFVDRTPGSFIEEKEYSLVWHHRMADPEFSDWLANELSTTLDELLAETELRAVRGQKCVEVKLAWANKGEAAVHLCEATPDAEFRLGIGDDRTDEDLFERLPEDAWTVHVGEGPSRARYRLPGPEAVTALFEALLRTEAGEAAS
jgi:trehalose 6-phosphate synthase/phosphatase